MEKIRRADKKDKKELLKIQKEAFPTLSHKHQEKYFDLKIKNNEIFIIEKEKKVAGYQAFGVHLLEPPFAKSIFLEGLAVKREFRGRGFATLLINYMDKYCKNKRIPMIYLGTGDYKNNKSIKLYKRLGYKKLGSLKDINPESEYTYGQIFYGKIIK
jgi:ribosomal protein S18 acetylase RimI-like enzyme